ncbi:DUF3558 domain-containing protein [Nocardia asteroides]|uniref:DUF3558 domain-containing protein n=1 Tax=Nocardia asteroides NBRC 15531 TaxID=1110697 RepID=U5EK94_NOCAS|nr:DUF3558 domain-containing protein [Nocardia asteroides]UGT49827.1 DUF3558 domain-containing protein [Nocardia asteroides]SFM02216.1 Protein of unknown function [Nocardia asteroides]VEG37423.1 Protein of uncharacterised function (DUF3558) [Nocardia asteroides]BAO99002.1 hypothetical protein [Nocardia asteroides NBRC 15531]GAD86816.1 hypothetical protein NCAST_33_01950 [Nocardia asteroides NBRC 15531]
MRAWRAAVLAVTMVGVAGGCSDPEPVQTAPTSSGTTVATTSADPSAGLWDPCTLPDSAISAAGLNTSTKEKDVAGVAFEGWKVCGWQDSGKTYTLTAASTTHTLADARARTDYTSFAETTLGTHRALVSRPIGASHDLACYFSIEVGTGLVEFDVQNRASVKTAGDPCAEVQRLSEAFEPYLPSK